MSRKRKSDQTPSTDTSTAVAEPPAPELPVAAFVPAEPPATEPKADGKSFVERVGQKKWTAAPDPFGIAHDRLAGVRLFESKIDKQMAIKFEEKPSQPVIDRMKEAGYRWNPADRIWAHPVFPETALSTGIDAERLYQEVRQMIRDEKGIDATKDIPF